MPVRVDTNSMGLMELAQALAGSGYFKDTRDAAQAVVKVLYGQELGIPPVSAMMGIHIIEGKPAPSANLLATIVKKSGVYNYRVREHSDTAAEVEFFEHGESIGKNRFTMQDAQRAGLAGKAVWKSYPRQMLFARCMSEGVRTFCPDLFGGAPVYTPEELGAEVNGDGDVIETTGQVIEHPALAESRGGRVAQAVRGGEKHTSFVGATTEKAAINVNALKHSIKAQLTTLGYPDPTKPLAYLNGTLGTQYAKSAEVADHEWNALDQILTEAVRDRAACFAIYKALCKLNGDSEKDDDQRRAVWGGLAGRAVETSGEFLPAEWAQLRASLAAAVETEEAQQKAAATTGTLVEEDPFQDQ